MAMEKNEGIPQEEGRKKIWLKDSKGLIIEGRAEGGISSHKAPFAHPHAPMKELNEIVKELKPSVLIGAAAQGGVFTEEIIRDMTAMNETPVIFALSNPTSKAECTAEEAYKFSNGKAVFASGSPFPDYEADWLIRQPGQGNNAYIFPGVSLGVICTGIHHISESVFLSSAVALANMVTEDDLKVGRMYPPLTHLRECSIKIATKIAEDAYLDKTASTYPEPSDKEAFIRKQLYDYEYDGVSALPARYSWPEAVVAPHTEK